MPFRRVMPFRRARHICAGCDAVIMRRAINVSVRIASGKRPEMDARGQTSIVRASVHCYNTDQENALLRAIAEFSL